MLLSLHQNGHPVPTHFNIGFCIAHLRPAQENHFLFMGPILILQLLITGRQNSLVYFKFQGNRYVQNLTISHLFSWCLAISQNGKLWAIPSQRPTGKHTISVPRIENRYVSGASKSALNPTKDLRMKCAHMIRSFPTLTASIFLKNHRTETSLCTGITVHALKYIRSWISLPFRYPCWKGILTVVDPINLGKVATENAHCTLKTFVLAERARKLVNYHFVDLYWLPLHASTATLALSTVGLRHSLPCRNLQVYISRTPLCPITS